MGVGWKVCADELEGALSALRAIRETTTDDQKGARVVTIPIDTSELADNPFEYLANPPRLALPDVAAPASPQDTRRPDMKAPSLSDTQVKVRAYLTDETFGYEHWRAAQFSAPTVPSSRYAVLTIFQSEAERDAFLAPAAVRDSPPERVAPTTEKAWTPDQNDALKWRDHERMVSLGLRRCEKGDSAVRDSPQEELAEVSRQVLRYIKEWEDAEERYHAAKLDGKAWADNPNSVGAKFVRGQIATAQDSLRALRDELDAALTSAAVRDGAAPSSAPLDLAVIDRRLEEVATMHQDSGGSATFLGAYWEGYAEGLKYAKSSAMTDLGAAHGSRASSETQNEK